MASHPPIESRINALLALANVRAADFEAQARQMDKAAAAKQHVERPPEPTTVLPVYAAPVPVAVAGPVTAAQPAAVVPRHKVAAGARHVCPSCGGSLGDCRLRGRPHPRRSRCGGRWAHTGDVARIVARREVTFTDEQRRLAADLTARGVELRKAAARGALRSPGGLRTCPTCGRTMIRRLYSYDFAIDIDYCAPCDSYWFDRDELEVLQVLAEGPSS